jgi:hypothetical protein
MINMYSPNDYSPQFQLNGKSSKTLIEENAQNAMKSKDASICFNWVHLNTVKKKKK